VPLGAPAVSGLRAPVPRGDELNVTNPRDAYPCRCRVMTDAGDRPHACEHHQADE
jgi:hypothetical protein